MIFLAAGTRSCRTSSRFATNEFAMLETPVTLPPGWLRLATSPALTGSSAETKTIGIVDVADFAANADVGPPDVAMTATLRLTSSAASAGNADVGPPDVAM